MYLGILGSSPTRYGLISIKVMDCSVKYHVEVLEDMPHQVGKFFILYDFIVLEMEEYAQIPIILGRPFLAIIGATIDVGNGMLSL